MTLPRMEMMGSSGLYAQKPTRSPVTSKTSKDAKRSEDGTHVVPSQQERIPSVRSSRTSVQIAGKCEIYNHLQGGVCTYRHEEDKCPGCCGVLSVVMSSVHVSNSHPVSKFVRFSVAWLNTGAKSLVKPVVSGVELSRDATLPMLTFVTLREVVIPMSRSSL